MNWYLVRCKECDDGVTMSFETVDERTQWVNIHRSAHVLESWDVWEEPRNKEATLKMTLLNEDGSVDESKEPFTAESRTGVFVPTSPSILDARHQLVADDGMEIYPDEDYSPTNLLGTAPVIASHWKVGTYVSSGYPELVRENNVRIINEMTRKSRRVDEALAALQIAARAVLISPTAAPWTEGYVDDPWLDALKAAIDAIDAMMPVTKKDDEEEEE